MADDILSYIKKGIDSGFSKEDITKKLLNAGYKSEHIKYLFSQLDIKREHKHVKLLFLFIILTLVVSSIIFIKTGIIKNENTILPTLQLPGPDLKISKEVMACNEEHKDIRCLALRDNDIKKCGTDLECTDLFILYDGIKKSATDCNALNTKYYKEVCETIKKTSCDKIEEQGLKESCITYKIILNAIEKSQISICENASTNFIGLCRAMVDKKYNCGDYTDICRDKIILDMAIEQKNITICSHISSEWDRNRCILTIRD